MKLEIKEKDATAIVSVYNKLTATALNQSLRGSIKALFDQGLKRVIINLDKVTQIDSTGIGELVSAYTAATNSKATLQLMNIPDSSKELLEITNLLDIFEVVNENDPDLQVFSQ
ncbi:MAG: STAS domain-containing protein [Fibrobacter sp.]|nr:STAS domain-containing protein [Fibrobacter sp.]